MVWLLLTTLSLETTDNIELCFSSFSVSELLYTPKNWEGFHRRGFNKQLFRILNRFYSEYFTYVAISMILLHKKLKLTTFENMYLNSYYILTVFSETDYIFWNKRTLTESCLLDIFVYLFNVWLNRRPLDSHNCFCIQYFTKCHIASRKLDRTLMGEWE